MAPEFDWFPQRRKRPWWRAFRRWSRSDRTPSDYGASPKTLSWIKQPNMQKAADIVTALSDIRLDDKPPMTGTPEHCYPAAFPISTQEQLSIPHQHIVQTMGTIWTRDAPIAPPQSSINTTYSETLFSARSAGPGYRDGVSATHSNLEDAGSSCVAGTGCGSDLGHLKDMANPKISIDKTMPSPRFLDDPLEALGIIQKSDDGVNQNDWVTTHHPLQLPLDAPVAPLKVRNPLDHLVPGRKQSSTSIPQAIGKEGLQDARMIGEKSCSQESEGSPSLSTVDDSSTSADEESLEDNYWLDFGSNSTTQPFPYAQTTSIVLRRACELFAVQWYLQTSLDPAVAGMHDAHDDSSKRSSDADNNSGAAAPLDSLRRRRVEKRDSGSGDDGNTDEGEDGRGGSRRSKKPKLAEPEENKPVFACPFFKSDGPRYHECLCHVLHRIKDVKQHLFRRHLQPLFCIICGAVFATQEEQETHLLQQSCTRSSSFQRPEGITKDQRDKLSRRVSKMLSSEEQWYSVWDIVFPETQRPASPYIQSAYVEVFEDIRRFADANLPTVISEQLRTTSIPYAVQGEERFLNNFLADCNQRLLHLFTSRLTRTPSLPATATSLDNNPEQEQTSSTGATRSSNPAPELRSDLGSSDMEDLPELSFPAVTSLAASQHNQPEIPDYLTQWALDMGPVVVDYSSFPTAGDPLTEQAHLPQPGITEGNDDTLALIDIPELENSVEHGRAMAAFQQMVSGILQKHTPVPQFEETGAETPL